MKSSGVDWEELVRAIRREPDADAPRLVCADWLLDRGDSRGEWIVLECRLRLASDQRIPSSLEKESPERRAMFERADAIANADRTRWLEPIVKLGAQGWRWRDPPRFRRGFVETVKLVGTATPHFPAICRLEPIIDLMLASCGPKNFAHVAEVAELRELRRLEVTGKHKEGIEALLASQGFGDLHELDIHSVSITPPIIKALLRGNARPTRTKLLPDPHHVEELAAGGFYENIVAFEHWQPITDEMLIALGKASLPKLRALHLQESRVTARGFEALGPKLDQLERLDFQATPMTTEIADVMIHFMTSHNLRSLAHTGVGWTEGIDRFMSSPAFEGVEELDLRHGPFHQTVLERSPYRKSLRKLSIGWTKPKTGFLLPGVVVVEVDEDDV